MTSTVPRPPRSTRRLADRPIDDQLALIRLDPDQLWTSQQLTRFERLEKMLAPENPTPLLASLGAVGMATRTTRYINI